MERTWKCTRPALQVGEVAIAPLRPQRLQSRFEEGIAVVMVSPSVRPGQCYPGLRAAASEAG